VRLGQPGQTFTCDNCVEITVDKDRHLLHRPYGILGRGTMVVQATSLCGRFEGLPLVVKLSFPEESRISETKILDTVQKNAGHLPDVADHVLDYIAAKSSDYSTSDIRKRLKLNTKGARKLTIVVFEKLEGDISALDGIEMWDVAYQIDKCNRALWQVGIQHRDISLGNMMFKRIDGEIRGYLIDFDLASLAGCDSHNLDRTGTMPFMALELLESVGPGQAPVLHTYAHDAEAVCWVMVWLGVQYAAGKRVGYSFEDWEMVDAVTCYQKKLNFGLGNLHLHPFTKPNELLQEPIRDILGKFLIHRTHHLLKRLTGAEVPDPDIDGWMEGCDKAIRAQVS